MSGLAAVRDQSGLIMVGEPGEPLQFSPFDSYPIYMLTVWARQVGGVLQWGYRTFQFYPVTNVKPVGDPALTGDFQQYTVWDRNTAANQYQYSIAPGNGTSDLTYHPVENIRLSAAAGTVPNLPPTFPAPSGDSLLICGSTPLFRPRRFRWKRR